MPDYNSTATKLTIDPGSLESLAKTSLKAVAEQAVGRISAVGDIWDGLALSWNGQTQAEADDFNGRWQTSMKTMFGTPDDEDDPGLFNKILDVIYMAAGNFAGTESGITDSFQKMADGLANPPSDGGGPSDSELPPIQIDV